MSNISTAIYGQIEDAVREIDTASSPYASAYGAGNDTNGGSRLVNHATSRARGIVQPERASDLTTPVLSSRLTPESVDRVLFGVGVDDILEEIASGSTPATLAAHYELPMRAFRTWLYDNAVPDELQDAIRMCGDSLMAKAVGTLSITPESPAHGAQLRALADQFKSMAERLNADVWAPQKKSEPAPPSVNILIHNGDKIPGVNAALGRR